MGTVNQNLPGFVVVAPRQTYAGTQVYSNDFLPAVNQGTLVVPGAEPVANVKPRLPVEKQRQELLALQALNKLHLDTREHKAALSARMKSFEIAYGMQQAVPEAFDFSKENKETLESYAIQPDSTTGFGWQCLAARRLIERGVRFVELIDTGSSGNWDRSISLMKMPGETNLNLLAPLAII